ncbi:YycH family regulatory protein [Pontibacillus salicampi]|uniref:YycH family regulatory protein n=1 Tax=Pontibacillus salicampi TaxID=1449801 RepID=A0ABV6LUQ8_9BACI
MRTETIKTIVLTILVATSLLLTFAIWNYQPQLDVLEDGDNYLKGDTRISGEQKSLNTLVKPSQVIFHEGGSTYAMDSYNTSMDMYTTFQGWRLIDFQSVSKNKVNRESSVEIIFPTSLPLSILVNTLTVNEDEDVPKYMVDRIFVDISSANSNNHVHFYSDENEQMYQATTENINPYTEYLPLINDTGSHVEHLSINEKRENPIYIPAGEVKVPKFSFFRDELAIEPMVNVLFNDRNKVLKKTPTNGESYYIDDYRQLAISEPNRYMRFTYNSPSEQEASETMTRADVIKESQSFINDHYGWTDNYVISHMNSTGSTVQYRIHQNGYPVFNDAGLSVMEQSWRNKELYSYNRSLVQFDTEIDSNSPAVTLMSGADVKQRMENKIEQYPLLVEDIRIGYTMIQKENEYEVVFSLQPAWYYKTVGGGWKLLKESELVNKGGVQ